MKNGSNPCDHALIVNGDDVIMYGLAAEHTLKDVVLWNGDHGATFFFQSELPYDVRDYPYAGYTGELCVGLVGTALWLLCAGVRTSFPP